MWFSDPETWAKKTLKLIEDHPLLLGPFKTTFITWLSKYFKAKNQRGQRSMMMEELVPNQIDCWAEKYLIELTVFNQLFFRDFVQPVFLWLVKVSPLWSKLMTNGTEEGDRWEIGLGITVEKKASVALPAVTDCEEPRTQRSNRKFFNC